MQLVLYLIAWAHASFCIGLCQSLHPKQREFHAFILNNDRGMATIQIITAMTLDGFLSDKDDELLQWVRTDRQGFPFWYERSTFTLPPGYPMLDLICEKEEKDASFVYTAEISGKESLGLLRGLSIYHLIDEIVIYILPLTYGKGITCLQQFPANRWILHQATIFKNGITRLIYRKSSR